MVELADLPAAQRGAAGARQARPAFSGIPK